MNSSILCKKYFSSVFFVGKNYGLYELLVLNINFLEGDHFHPLSLKDPSLLWVPE